MKIGRRENECNYYKLVLTRIAACGSDGADDSALARVLPDVEAVAGLFENGWLLAGTDDAEKDLGVDGGAHAGAVAGRHVEAVARRVPAQRPSDEDGARLAVHAEEAVVVGRLGAHQFVVHGAEAARVGVGGRHHHHGRAAGRAVLAQAHVVLAGVESRPVVVHVGQLDLHHRRRAQTTCNTNTFCFRMTENWRWPCEGPKFLRFLLHFIYEALEMWSCFNC
jgi:hypothetical protein